MGTFQRVVPAAALWLMAIVAGAIGVKAAGEISKELPRRVPLVAILPQSATQEDVARFSGAMESCGGMAQYISKDEGLNLLREQMGSGGAFLDSAVMSDLPGNPLQDMFIVRTSNAGQYGELARIASEVVPGAQVLYDARVVHKMDMGLAAARWVSTALLAILCVLCLVSIRDRMTAAGCRSEFTVDASGIGEFLRHVFWSALAPMLGTIAVLGGAISAAGYFASSHPGHRMGAYILETAAFMRFIAPDAFFAAWVAAGWVALIGIASGSRSSWRSRPANLIDPSCETIVRS